MVDIKVPTVGESISEVTLLKWNKKNGDYVERDEVIAELESEKATFEVNAEKAGTLQIAAQEGDTLKIGDLLAKIDEAAVKQETKPKTTVEKAPEKKKDSPVAAKTTEKGNIAQAPAKEKPANSTNHELASDRKITPVASAIMADKHVDPQTVSPSGIGGKILKDDVLAALSNPGKVTGGKPLFSREEKGKK